MIKFNRQEIKDRLVTEFGYPAIGADLITDKILNLQPELSQPFEEWWTTGDIPSLNIEGFSLEDLETNHSMNTIAAFLTLDWLIREPEKARTSLNRGHDHVN